MNAEPRAVEWGLPSRYAAAPCLNETAQILIGFAIAALLISLAALMVGVITFLVSKPPDLAALGALFVEEQRIDIRPEPVERAAYLAAIICSMPVGFFSVALARRISSKIEFAPTVSMTALVVLSTLFVVTFIGSGLMSYLMGRTLLIVCLVLVVMVAVVATAIALGRSVVLAGHFWRLLSALSVNRVLLAAILFPVVAVRLRSETMLYGDPHFEAVFYSITQVMAGKTLLADLPSQYGLYPELLRPLFMVTGFSVLKFTALMTLLQGIASLSLLAACMRMIHLNWLRLLAILTLFMFVGSTWVAIDYDPMGHEYYQLWPLRFFFPAISLLLFLEAQRRGMSPRWVALVAVVAGIAIVWNLEAGIAAFGALVACLLVRALFADRKDRRRTIWSLLTGSFIPVAVAAAFFLYLSLKSGGKIHLHDLVKYQTIFYSAGFGMLPMPLSPHPWMAVLGLYLFGLIGAIFAYVRRRRSMAWDAVLYLSVVGLGLFTYYQGRSHDIVLTFVVWPAIVIAFVLADRTVRAVRAGMLPRPAAWSVAPVVAFGMIVSLLYVADLPKLFGMAYREAMAIKAGRSASLADTISFIKTKVDGSRTAIIVDPGQSVYFAATGLASAIGGPGMIEMLLIEDRDRFVEALLTSPVKHLFIRLDEHGNLPEPYRRVQSVYQISDTAKSGLGYFEPRVPTPDRL